MPHLEPFLLRTGQVAQRGSRLPRVHKQFDEHFIQELLVDNPELLPIQAFRPDAGDPLCIGREVPTRDSGTIDNLYLTTTGYVVVSRRNYGGIRRAAARSFPRSWTM